MDNNFKANRAKPRQFWINCCSDGSNNAHNNWKSDAFNMDSFAKPLDDISIVSKKREKPANVSLKKVSDTKPNKPSKAKSAVDHKPKDVLTKNDSNATSSADKKCPPKDDKKENEQNDANSKIGNKLKSDKSANKQDNSLPKKLSNAYSTPKRMRQPIDEIMDTKLSANKLSKIDKAKLDDSLRQLFTKLDKKYFGGTLASNNIAVKWTNKMFICAGITYDDPIEIRISAKLHQLLPHKDLEETLLHEMIHAYHLLMKTCDNHGPKFLSMMSKINTIGKYNITVGHDFGDQMNLYKQSRRDKKLEKIKKLSKSGERCA